MTLKISEANLGSLRGMPDVDYDFSVSESLAMAFRAAATQLDGQRWTISTHRTTGKESFRGYYATLFESNGTTQLSDLDEIVKNLRLVATQVDAIAEKARAENNRRRQAREWAERQANRSEVRKFIDSIFGGEPAPFSEIDSVEESRGPAETIVAAAAASRETPQSASGPSSGTSSAKPANLRGFATNTRASDDLLCSRPVTLESHCTSFQTSCSWATLDASSVISGYRQWLAANDEEARWADVIAQAFEDAGSEGDVATLPDAAIGAALAASGVQVTRSDIVIYPPIAYGSPPTTGYCDDPVNAATGNFVENEEDLAFTGAAGALAMRRCYSSMNPAVGAFGPGWSSWAEAGIRFDAEGAWLRLSDGREIYFPRLGEGWDRAVDENLWLSRDDEDGYLLTSSWGLRWLLDAAGRVVSVSEGEGTKLRFDYSSDGRLVRMTHQFGRWIELVWDEAAWRVTGLTTSDGRTVSYHYDDGGRLVAVETGGSIRRYRWDDTGLICAVIDADGVVEAENTYDEHARVLTQRSAFGRVTHFGYLSGGVTVSADADGSRGNTWVHDARGRLVGIIDADGRRQSTSYDRCGNPVLVTQRDGSATVTAYDARGRRVMRQLPSGARLTWDYDELDRLVCSTVTHSDDSSGTGDSGEVSARTRFSYAGDQRNPSQVVDAEGGITSMVWDQGLLREIVDPVGVRLRFSYDDHGDLVATTDAAGNTARLERDAQGRITAAITPMGHRTTFAYHPESGVLISRTDPTGARWGFEHTEGGRLSATIDPLGARTQVDYGEHGEAETTTDPLGRVLGQKYDDLGNLSSVELPDGSVWAFGYDALSRLVSMRDTGAGEWQMDYGPDGRLTSAVDATGVARSVQRGPFGEPTRVVDGDEQVEARYDRLGRLVAVTNPDGSQQISRYDRCGRLVESVDAAGARTAIERDAAGRIVAVTQPTGHTYRYEYDECGRWVATISTGGDRYRLVYDADGRITGEIWPTGEQVSTRFDAAGRIVERREPGRGVVSFRYDRVGRIVGVQDPWNGPRRFRYDAAGQLVAAIDGLGGVTSFEYNEVGRQVAMVDPLGGRTERSYDQMGRVRSQTDPLGRTTHFSYDAAGRITSRTQATGRVLTWAYDRSGRLAEIRDGAELLSRVERDFASRTMTFSDGDGQRVNLAWDCRGNLVERLRDGVGVSYTYDAAGRRATMRRPDGSVTSYRYDANNRLAGLDQPGLGAVSIERDGLGRIVAVHGPGLEAEWVWRNGSVAAHRVNRRGFIQQVSIERDAQGRVVADVRDGLRTSYDYDAAGQLVKTVSAEGITTVYEWDAAGRLASESTNGTTTCYRYDAAGQLLFAQRGDQPGVSYAYDEAGRRTREIGPDAERRFEWDPRGFLTSVTAIAHDGDRVQALRQDLRTDAGGELAQAAGQDLYWDSAATLPALAQVGGRAVLHALAATALVGLGEDATWLVPDTDGRGTDPGSLLGQVRRATPTPGNRTDAWGHGALPLGPAPFDADQPDGLSMTALGGVSIGGLEWMTSRVYDPTSRGFLSPDPLAPVSGVVWSGNPYSFAGNDPVGKADPLGLRPVSEADLRAYQQASNGMLASAISSAGNWLKDNWEYVAAGALIIGGMAVMATGVGGPLGAAMIAGALTGAGSSIWSQKAEKGSVDWGRVAIDGGIGAVTALAGGGAAAAAGRATAGMTSCLGRNILVGAAEGMADGGVSNGLTYLTSGGPLSVGGFAQAVGEGGLTGGLGGAATGALSKVTGTARFGCFTADTGVAMADGTTKAISDICVGDRVLSHDAATGEDTTGVVEAIHVHQDVPILLVTTSAGTVQTTTTHPFYVRGKGFLPAGELRAGDVLHTPDGQLVTVESIQATGQRETVYNFTVTGLHNYHVVTSTGARVLVHNSDDSCGPGPGGVDGAEDGIVYLRHDNSGDLADYIGQTKSDARYFQRQGEHALAYPDSDFEFEVLGRAEPGTDLNRLEEDWIRAGGGPTNRSHLDGGLSNRRHQMSDANYAAAGGTIGKD